MYKKISLQYVLSASLVLFIFNISCADTIPLQSSESPCTFEVYEAYNTKYSRVEFMHEKGSSNIRWLCYEGKALLQARPSVRGGYHSLWTDQPALEFLKPGNKIVKKNGYPILLRMVIQEADRDYDNVYWLIDFREKEPRVIGPFGEGAGDGSETYEVSWGKDDVAISSTGGVQVYTYNYNDKKIIRVQ